jgi:hypothetical protein
VYDTITIMIAQPFGGSLIFGLLWAFVDSPATMQSISQIALPVRVLAQEGCCESTGRYEIATREGRARAQSAQPKAEGKGKHRRRPLPSIVMEHHFRRMLKGESKKGGLA